MEPAPLSADEIDQPIAPALAIDHEVDAIEAAHAAGEDVEPPYLRLRTLIDESLAKDAGNPQTPDLDLTEFAVVSENTGVEMIRRDTPPPPYPRTLIADVASFPHAMPTGFEPSTELLVPARTGLSVSRARLIGWGALAFCAGLVASAAVHMLAQPARIGATANAATESATPSAVAPTVVAPTPAATAPVVIAPAITETAKTVASDTDSQPALAVSAPVRTRSGATSRGQTRARGKMRSVARNGSADALFPADSKSSSAATDDEPAAPAPASTHRAGWVDPFVE